MPTVTPQLQLRNSLRSIQSERNWTEAELSRKLLVNPMTLNRFLKTGRALPRTVARIRSNMPLIARGREEDESTGMHESISLSSHVIATLEFLLAASREKARGEK
jgi:hypothetical protein